MNAIVFPTTRLKGCVELPASKSYSVRAFMAAACGGRSCIIAPSLCDDAMAAALVAKDLGARFQRKGERWNVVAEAGRENLKCINVKESGTVLRMLLPLVALRNKVARVTGQGTLKGRPTYHLIDTLRKLGVSVKGVGSKHSIPIDFAGGRLRGGTIKINGSLSSQFISALLMACPKMDEDVLLRITGKEIVSTDYIQMTLLVLQKAGIQIQQQNLRTYKIKGRQRYKGLKSFHVPSDYGLAAFLMAAAALTDSDLVLKGSLNDDFIQADGRILSILKKMGIHFKKTSRSIAIKGPFQLKGGVFSLKDCPDLLPILSVLALFSNKPTKFSHIEHVRSKESDRISDLCHELEKIGARVDEGRSYMTVHPLDETLCKQNVDLSSHDDHRLAMAFCVLGLRIGLKVKGIKCISKSYPDFLRDIRAIGGKVKKY